MFPSCCRLFVAALLLLAAVTDCQQAEVGEAEAGKGSSSLAEFVDNLIDQMKVKVGECDISTLKKISILVSFAEFVDNLSDVKESREREAKKGGVEVEEVDMVEEEELPSWKVMHERILLKFDFLRCLMNVSTIFVGSS